MSTSLINEKEDFRAPYKIIQSYKEPNIREYIVDSNHNVVAKILNFPKSNTFSIFKNKILINEFKTKEAALNWITNELFYEVL